MNDRREPLGYLLAMINIDSRSDETRMIETIMLGRESRQQRLAYYRQVVRMTKGKDDKSSREAYAWAVQRIAELERLIDESDTVLEEDG